MVALVPIGPYLIHAYWEVTTSALEDLSRSSGKDIALFDPVLRFYDVTGIAFDGTNSKSFFDVNIDLQAGNWYVNLWRAGKSYFAELGFRTVGGEFHPIAKSNFAHTPPAMTAEEGEANYMLVKGAYEVVENLPVLVERDLPSDAPAIPPCLAEHGRPDASGAPSLHVKKHGPDFAEMGERAFIPGLSSEARRVFPKRKRLFAG